MDLQSYALCLGSSPLRIFPSNLRAPLPARKRKKCAHASPHCNPRVEIPALRQTFPSFLVWPIYSARLCTLIKTADTHDPESTSKAALSICCRTRSERASEGAVQPGESPLRCTDDMFIPWLYTALPLEASLAYRSTHPPTAPLHCPSLVRIYIWTLRERHFKVANRGRKKRASLQLLDAEGMIAAVRLQSVI